MNPIGVDCASVDEYMDPPHINQCEIGRESVVRISLPAPSLVSRAIHI